MLSPCSCWVWHLVLFYSSLHCPVPLTSPRPSVCLLSQHCWFRLCLCDRVMSLWNSGDGLCWVEGRLGSTHHPCCGVHLSGVCVVMVVCDDSACLVLSHCVAGCGIAVCEGCVVSSSVFLLFHHPLASSCSLPLSFCVGVRGSVRAALRAHTLSPNTIVFPCVCLVFCSLHHPPFFTICLSFCWNGGG